MKNFIYIILWAILCGCTPEDFAIHPFKGGCNHPCAVGATRFHGANGSDGVQAEEAGRETTFWMCTVSYPESYDWRRDSAYGNTECRIRLFRNFGEIMDIPGGPAGKASPDPDRIWIHDGHLYTEWVDGRQTFIKRDGTDYITCSGSQMICGIAGSKGVVWILTKGRNGRGVCLWKDREKLYSRDDALLAGGLTLDEGRIFFGYSANVGGYEKAFLVQDGNASETYIDSRFILHEMTFTGEYLCWLVSDRFTGKYNYTEAGLMRRFPMDYDLAYASLCRIGGRCCIYGAMKSGSNFIWHPVLGLQEWEGSDRLIICPDKAEDDSFTGIMASNDGDVSVLIDGYDFQAASDMFLFNSRCACRSEGKTHIALTPRQKGLQSIIWSDGKTMQVNAGNGYIAGIDVTYISQVRVRD